MSETKRQVRPLPEDPMKRIRLILYRAGVRKMQPADPRHGPGFVIGGNIVSKLASTLTALGMRITAVGPDHMLVREAGDRDWLIGNPRSSANRDYSYERKMAGELPHANERMYATKPQERLSLEEGEE